MNAARCRAGDGEISDAVHLRHLLRHGARVLPWSLPLRT